MIGSWVSTPDTPDLQMQIESWLNETGFAHVRKPAGLNILYEFNISFEAALFRMAFADYGE